MFHTLGSRSSKAWNDPLCAFGAGFFGHELRPHGDRLPSASGPRAACGEGRTVEIRARAPAKIYMSRRGSFFPRLFFHRPKIYGQIYGQ